MRRQFSNPKSFFTIIALVFGVIFTFLLPPGHIPDEPNHFRKAFYVTQGNWSGQVMDQRLGGELPTSLGQIFTPFRKLRFNYEERVDWQDFKHASQVNLQAEHKSFQDFPNTAYYTPIGYIPQAVSIFFLRIFELPPLVIFYCTRLMGLFFWIIMIRIAITWMPNHKWLLALLALLPSSLWIHCGVTADTMTNAVSFLLLALLLKLQHQKKAVSWKEMGLAILLVAILSFTKIVYFPIFFLVLFIPEEKFAFFKTKPIWNKLGIFTMGMLVIIAIIFSVYKTSKSTYISYDHYNPAYRIGQQINEGVNPELQMKFVLSHPFLFSKIMVISYFRSAPATVAHYFGKFGWEQNYLNVGWIVLLIIAIMGVALSDSQRHIKALDSFILIGIGLIMMIGFAIIIYLQWSPPKSAIISSLSGRYMIPIFPFFFLALPSVFTTHRKSIRQIAQGIIVASLCGGIVAVILRYYV